MGKHKEMVAVVTYNEVSIKVSFSMFDGAVVSVNGMMSPIVFSWSRGPIELVRDVARWRWTPLSFLDGSMEWDLLEVSMREV